MKKLQLWRRIYLLGLIIIFISILLVIHTGIELANQSIESFIFYFVLMSSFIILFLIILAYIKYKQHDHKQVVEKLKKQNKPITLVKVNNRTSLKSNQVLFKSLDIGKVSSYKIECDHLSMFYLEAGKSLILLDILNGITSKGAGFRRSNHLLNYFRGDYYTFKVEHPKLVFYFTNFIKEKDFEYIIEHKVRLAKIKIGKTLCFTNNEVGVKDLLNELNKLKCKIAIYCKRNQIQIAIENQNSLLRCPILHNPKHCFEAPLKTFDLTLKIHQQLIQINQNCN
jgi:hypothetical protein